MKKPELTPQAAEVLTGMMRAGLLAPSCDHETQKSQSLVPVAEVVPPPPDGAVSLGTPNQPIYVSFNPTINVDVPAPPKPTPTKKN